MRPPVRTASAPELRESIVTAPNRPTRYQALVRRTRPRRNAPKSVEEQLDRLLTPGAQSTGALDPTPVELRSEVVARIRRQMGDELTPVFEDVQSKYESSGLLMAIDADDLLNGGFELAIEMQYATQGMRLDGTVTPDGIAFHESRFTDNVPGITTTGPMLRARSLCGATFREFLCERIAQLVRSAARLRGSAARSEH